MSTHVGDMHVKLLVCVVNMIRSRITWGGSLCEEPSTSAWPIYVSFGDILEYVNLQLIYLPTVSGTIP